MTKLIKYPPVRAEGSDVYAVIYVRVSTARQLLGASLETQVKACEENCKNNGWCVLQIFREEGESAKTADRTQLQAMLRFCGSATPHPEYVLIYTLDRFARNGVDHDALRLRLMMMRTKLRCVQTPLGETPQLRAMERIFSALPQLNFAPT